MKADLFRSPHSDETARRLFLRAVLLLGAALYGGWAVFLAFAVPSFWDAPSERFAIAGCFLLVLLLSWPVLRLPRRLATPVFEGLTYGVVTLSLLHFLSLVWRSGVHPGYVAGLLILLSAENLVFLSERWFLLYSGVGIIGGLTLLIMFSAGMSADFAQAAWVGMVGGTITIQAVGYVLLRQRARLAEAARLHEVAKNSAIAKTTQMVAHDVRKPFTLLQLGLDFLERSKTHEEFQKVLPAVRDSVTKGLASVNTLLDDLMEIGRADDLQVESVAPDELVAASIADARQYRACSGVEFRTDFAHGRNVVVDPRKIQRVFSNIVGNAIQAIGGKGTIWFSTADLSPDGLVEFRIGNTGPLIAESDIPHLFEAFFTKNKRGGTGLGLAIAKKVVVAHGGTIACEFTRDKRFLEFVFSLPAAPKS